MNDQNTQILEGFYEEGLEAGMSPAVAQTYAEERFEDMAEAV